MPVSQLDDGRGTDLLTRVLDPIWQKKATTASRVRGRIEKVLDWAKAKGYRDGENPARWNGHLAAVYPTKGKVAPVKHLEAMPYRDVPAFMAKLRRQTSIGARALEFAILTAARTSEVLQAKRSEIDRAARMWIVPAERMKMRREHRAPLSAAALKIIDALPRDSKFLFPGKHGKPLERRTLLRVLEAMGIEATAHGFRSTFMDWGARAWRLSERAIGPGDRTCGRRQGRGRLPARHYAGEAPRAHADWERFCNG